MFQETGCGRWRVTCASDSRGHLYPAQAAPPQPRCRASKGRVGTGCNRSPAMSQQSLRGKPAPQNLSELRHPALCQQSRKTFLFYSPSRLPSKDKSQHPGQESRTWRTAVLTWAGGGLTHAMVFESCVIYC